VVKFPRKQSSGRPAEALGLKIRRWLAVHARPITQRIREILFFQDRPGAAPLNSSHAMEDETGLTATLRDFHLADASSKLARKNKILGLKVT
jgi:hypothetical protein